MEKYWYWLCNLSKIGNYYKKMEQLLNYFKTPELVYKSKKRELEKICILTEEDRNTILNQRDFTKIEEEYAKLQEREIDFVTKENKHYPTALKHSYEAPYALYVKGKLSNKKKKLAIIGARNCSIYGKEMALYFSRELVKYNIDIISGVARGIDTYAHIGALDGGGDTYGILGCGLDVVYPKENETIYRRIEQQGALISEYPLKTPPFGMNFPMRNRIISGMSDGIFVIEARCKSGSLITVDLGLEQGKQIYAIPGRIGDILSEGCNRLLKQGAKFVTSPVDILEDFIQLLETNNKNYLNEIEKKNKTLETMEKIVYAKLGLEPKHVNEIIRETKMPYSDLIEILLTLEWKHFVKQVGKNYYVRINRIE